MSGLGTLEDMGRSIIGSPQKAILIIHKVSGYKVPTESGVSIVKPEDIADKLAPGVLNQLPKGTLSHKLEVQYNPASLSIQAAASEVQHPQLQNDLGSDLPVQQKRAPSIVLGVDLIFDDVNVKDAFMAEKGRLSIGDGVTAVAGAVRNIAGEGYTVQPQTNGLIAATMNTYSRRATFRWADMEFTGDIGEVQAKYTMFSVSGKPIRSVVSLKLMQSVASTAARKKWEKAFNRAFGGSELDSNTGGKSAMDHVGNLLNVRF